MKDYMREMFSYPGLYSRSAQVKKVIKPRRIDYGSHKEQFFLLFEPEGEKKNKVIIWIHGGGWNSGSPYSFEYVGQSFALEGYHCVSLGYRLSPTNKYPAQIEDVCAAYNKAIEYLEKQGIDCSRVVVTGKGEAVEIAVYLDEPLPEKLAGHAGFNLEFLPSQYWAKTYLVDGRPDRFPRYAASETVTRPNSEKPRQYKGYKTYDDRGTDRYVDPLPLEQGREFILAPDAPERMITISSDDSDIMLYDGRMLAQNGWFVFRSLIPAGKTGKVITWTVEPNSVEG